MREHDDQRGGRGFRERTAGSGSYPRGGRDGEWSRNREEEKGRPQTRPGPNDERASDRSAASGQTRRPRLEDMDVFRLAHDLVLRIHELTGRFPNEARERLGESLRNAAAAVPAQLASGSSRWDRAERRDGVNATKEAAAQADYYVLLAKDLGHLSAADCDELREGYERIARMLSRLAQSLA